MSALSYYDYKILPKQIMKIFADYTVYTHDLIDSYVFTCHVYSDGCTKKTEYICIKIKKKNETTVYCNNMNFALFLEKCKSDDSDTDTDDDADTYTDNVKKLHDN
jgi:hypothetical protein